jgi:hypothetical protein
MGTREQLDTTGIDISHGEASRTAKLYVRPRRTRRPRALPAQAAVKLLVVLALAMVGCSVPLPLTVEVDQTMRDDYVVQLLAAVEDWNRAVPQRPIARVVVTSAPSNRRGTVWATTVPALPREALLGQQEREGTNDYAEIRLELRDTDVIDQQTLYTAWRHELGHAMGLGHSADRLSVMFSIVIPEEQSITLDDAETISARMASDRAL